jgi:hypothetical protein
MKKRTFHFLSSSVFSHALRKKLFDHIASILFVLLVFIVLLAVGVDRERDEREQRHELIGMMTKLKNVDFGSPMQKILFRETLEVYYPSEKARNDSVLRSIETYRIEQYTNKVYKTGGVPKGLSWRGVADLGGMYLNFIAVYIIALIVSYYAAQTLALYTFIQYKRQRSSYCVRAFGQFRLIGEKIGNGEFPSKETSRAAGFFLKACIKGAVSLVLFAPAYIIVYSLKSTIDTGRWVFMVVLAVISNGLLINYAHKFYMFLLTESRKGYVETAVVKGLNHSYAWNVPGGLTVRSILRWKKNFPEHVLQPVYRNARYQYIPTMKQYASFLITGLIIIEMALNIQGHLCYELLQDILYYRYEMALVIMFGIFLVVKGTEILVDYWFAYESAKYENRD